MTRQFSRYISFIVKYISLDFEQDSYPSLNLSNHVASTLIINNSVTRLLKASATLLSIPDYASKQMNMLTNIQLSDHVCD